MSLTELHKDIITKAEWVAIATSGGKGVHLAGTWLDHILFISDDMLLIPAGGYIKTGENLAAGSRVELLCGTRQVDGADGPGRGCLMSGTAEIQASGDYADIIKDEFIWARGTLVVNIQKVSVQL